jgi:hypothetical protein
MMRNARQVTGLFLALLAVMAQLTLAAAVPVSTVSLEQATVLCQHDGKPSAPVHQSPDCLLCFYCHSAIGPAGLLATPPLTPAPSMTVIARGAVLPPATAPPVRIVLAARPRGPPILV